MGPRPTQRGCADRADGVVRWLAEHHVIASVDNAVGVIGHTRTNRREDTGWAGSKCRRGLSCEDNVAANQLHARSQSSTVQCVASGTDEEVNRSVREIAAGLHRRLDEVTGVIQRLLRDEIPELGRDGETVELLGASVAGNVDTILRALQYRIDVQRVEAPTAAMEYARRLAQQGVPVHGLVRAYRLGQGRMNELVFADVEATDASPAVKVAVLKRMSAAMFAYIDWMSQQVVEAYEYERERWLEHQNSLRALRVRDILASDTTGDVDAASAAIRYPLRWHHLAVVVWYAGSRGEDDELPRLQRFTTDVGQAAGVEARPLFLAANAVCGWGWLPFRGGAPDVVDTVRQFASSHADPPSVAIGSMAAGVGGFRRSHRQAMAARVVAAALDPHHPSVVAAQDPGVSLTALLGGNVSEAREWVADVLGDLAGDSENDARLRATLHVYLSCRGSYKMAAEQLNLHYNTVKYRVGRAVARRGRPIDADRLDVEVALLLCQWYGVPVAGADSSPTRR